MKGFLGKIFGGKKEASNDEVTEIIGEALSNICELGQFDLSFEIHRDEKNDEIVVEMMGPDEEMLTARDGQLLDALQLYLKRVIQHKMADEKANVVVDAGGFRADANQSLIELAEKLKAIAVDRGKPVYFRALPPRDRKIIHQHLASDDRVKSRSIGEGLYKKIKIYPARSEHSERSQIEQTS